MYLCQFADDIAYDNDRILVELVVSQRFDVQHYERPHAKPLNRSRP